MKNFKILILPILVGISISFDCFSQSNWLLNGNFVAPGQFLGSTNNQFLELRQNNTIRTRYTNVNWPGYNNSPAVNNVSRVFYGLGNNYQLPFSMMHLGQNINANLQRPWMNVGTTYGAGADIMHLGLMQSPTEESSANVVDAVIAWGCNDDVFSPQNGPDNFRFLFISPTTVNNPGPNSPQGRETMRITPMGNIGMGDFSTMPLGIGSTYGQPRARLDVQFRNQLPLNTDNTAVNVFNDVVANESFIPFKRGINVNVQNSAEEQINESRAGDFFATGAKTNVGVQAEVIGIGGNSTGVFGRAINVDEDSQHFGVQGWARGAIQNVGVEGLQDSCSRVILQQVSMVYQEVEMEILIHGRDILMGMSSAPVPTLAVMRL